MFFLYHTVNCNLLLTYLLKNQLNILSCLQNSQFSQKVQYTFKITYFIEKEYFKAVMNEGRKR